MKAEQLRKILDLFPEAELTVWNDEVGSVEIICNDENGVTINLSIKKQTA